MAVGSGSGSIAPTVSTAFEMSANSGCGGRFKHAEPRHFACVVRVQESVHTELGSAYT